MHDLYHHNPLGRFTGLADSYARYRPDYPAQALDFLMERCQLGSHALVVDVGCGTGISSRLFALRGVPVIGIEPNAEMRGQAQTHPLPPDVPLPDYRAGQAEATGLPAAMADMVLAAQAFHWFEPTAALREFHRFLKPLGWAALVWNERDESDPFTAAYGKALRTASQAAALEMARGRAGEPLLNSPWFIEGQRFSFPHQQFVDEEGLLGRAFSTSYAPREAAQAEALAAILRQVFACYQQGGRATLHYETSIYLARRR